MVIKIEESLNFVVRNKLPVVVVEEAGVPGENQRPWASNWQTSSLAAAGRVHPFVIYKAGREPTPYW
jgi:hypothetical protein